MHIKKVVIIGAGGHAHVVVDAMLAQKNSILIEIRDDNKEKEGQIISGISVQTPIGELPDDDIAIHFAIGDNATRKKLYNRMLKKKHHLYTVIHPDATVSAGAIIGNGCFVGAGAVVAPLADIQDCTIINHGSIVDHECKVGAFSHIAPRAVLGGSVTVGSQCLIGSGAALLPGITVQDEAIVGAGAVVTCEVNHGNTVVGIPARPLGL